MQSTRSLSLAGTRSKLRARYFGVNRPMSLDSMRRENLRAAAYTIAFGFLIIYAGSWLIGLVAVVGGVVLALVPTVYTEENTLRNRILRRSNRESHEPIPWYFSPLPYILVMGCGLLVYVAAN